MDITKHSPFCLDLLNEIHQQRFARKSTGGKAFPHSTLVAFCVAVGDRPTWDKASQPALVEATLELMAQADPFIDE